MLALPYLQLQIKAEATLCQSGQGTCGTSTRIVASTLLAVIFQFGFMAVPGVLLAKRGHRRAFILPLAVPAIGSLFLTGLRNWVFAFAFATHTWLSELERGNSRWHWQAPGWQTHWAIASIVGLVLAALPSVIMASRLAPKVATRPSHIGEWVLAILAGIALVGVSLAVIGLIRPESWSGAGVPEAFVVGLFTLGVVYGRPARQALMACGLLGLMAWLDLTLFLLLRTGTSGFLANGGLQILPSWVVSFAVIGLCGALTEPIAAYLARRREAAGELAIA